MPTTTVRLPSHLLRALDAVAARRKASRNRLVAEACQGLVEEDLGEWPPGFLEMAHLSTRDRGELRGVVTEMEKVIRAARRIRRKPPVRSVAS